MLTSAVHRSQEKQRHDAFNIMVDSETMQVAARESRLIQSDGCAEGQEHAAAEYKTKRNKIAAATGSSSGWGLGSVKSGISGNIAIARGELVVQPDDQFASQQGGDRTMEEVAELKTALAAKVLELEEERAEHKADLAACAAKEHKSEIKIEKLEAKLEKLKRL